MKIKITLFILIFALSTALFAKQKGSTEEADLNTAIDETWKEFEEERDKRIASLEEDYKMRKQMIEQKAQKVWDKIEMSTRYEYVDYSPDAKTKTKVDFEKGVLTISVVEEKGKVDEKEVVKRLKKEVKDVDEKKDENGVEFLDNQIDWKEKLKARKSDNIKKEEIVSKEGKTMIKCEVEIPLKGDHVRERAKLYLPLILKYSKKQKVPADLVLAIIETESFFNPKARSGVGACGLMQLMPESAYDATRTAWGKHNMRKLTINELMTPDINLQLGTALLHQFMYWNAYFKRFSAWPVKQQLMVMAAYNGGQGRVGRWIKKNESKMDWSYDKFWKNLRDAMPKETQGYIKKVPERRVKYTKMLKDMGEL